MTRTQQISEEFLFHASSKYLSLFLQLLIIFSITFSNTILIYVVGPCHHGMARPQVADRGTASDKEGSCE